MQANSASSFLISLEYRIYNSPMGKVKLVECSLLGLHRRESGDFGSIHASH